MNTFFFSKLSLLIILKIPWYLVGVYKFALFFVDILIGMQRQFPLQGK